uniref:Protein FAM195A n=1 Tax=Esox lucius TaxID=8010 RepID=A0A3P9A7F7_ESOLU
MMYTITIGPSKLVTQRRTGPTQQIDNQINDFKHKQTPWSLPDAPALKIVFNRLNRKKILHTPPNVQLAQQPDEGFSAAHQDNVKFVYEAWQDVLHQVEEGGARDETGSARVQGPVEYSETNPSPALKNFVPIDLDEWWAQRFLATIDNLS